MSFDNTQQMSEDKLTYERFVITVLALLIPGIQFCLS
jgi:hypothetical protein